MKKMIFPCVVTALLLASCNSSPENNKDSKPHQFPKPGTTVASAQVAVTDDPLNHFTFSVKVIADSNIKDGVYDIDADYGPNYASGVLTMPKGGEDLEPLIRKGSSPYTFIIGFRMPGDTTFYDYFEVSSSRATTKMQYIRAYTF